MADHTKNHYLKIGVDYLALKGEKKKKKKKKKKKESWLENIERALKNLVLNS